jgi:hypothetical protein
MQFICLLFILAPLCTTSIEIDGRFLYCPDNSRLRKSEYSYKQTKILKIDEEKGVYGLLSVNKAILSTWNCKLINRVSVLSQTNDCYEDLPVQINLKGLNVTAYFSNDGLLKKSSENVTCSDRIQVFMLNGNLITVHKRKVSVVNQIEDYYDAFVNLDKCLNEPSSISSWNKRLFNQFNKIFTSKANLWTILINGFFFFIFFLFILIVFCCFFVKLAFVLTSFQSNLLKELHLTNI